MKSLEATLRGVRSANTKALVPYFMAGVTPEWTSHVAAAAHAGASAIEIGIPFSDPMMDGVVIQEASSLSLAVGTTIDSLCTELSRARIDVPLIAMTYYNLFVHYGLHRVAERLVTSGITGVIVPDLTLEESSEWREVCDEVDLATIFLVAPSTTPDRFARLTEATQGFCYASARMAVTGRSSGTGDAARVVEAVRSVSDVPCYVGIGISTPEQAASSAAVSDGAVVGSVLVDAIIKGATPLQIEKTISSFRSALDTITAAEK